MIRAFTVVVAIAIAVAVPAAAAQQTGRGSVRPQAAASASAGVRIAVRDAQGGGVNGVRLTLSGGQSGEFTTGPAGIVVIPNLKPGTYRVRCEREGFITLEREFSVRHPPEIH